MYTVFFDNFVTPNLDRTQWNVSHNGLKNCGIWVDGANTVNQNNSCLNLSIISSPGYTTTTWDNHTYTADYISGEVTTDSVFHYGSFECRAKYAHQRGSWPAFWAIGGDDIPCAQGGGAGDEIDISEFWSYTELMKSEDGEYCMDKMKLENNCHRYYNPGYCDGNSHFYHWYDEPMGSSMDDNFHVYKCVWTPDKIDFYMDNVLKNTVLNAVIPQYFPFRPLHVILSQQVTCLDCGTIVAPQTSSFDYVKIKKFFLAPEITCPTIICSTVPATMDVAPDASNITWALTPSYLFNGATTGTGKNSSITASSTYQGKGKITYTFNMPSGESFTAAKDIWIKGPDASEISFDVYKSNGVRATYTGNAFLLCPNTTYQIYAMNSGPVPLSNYTWTVPTAWTIYYTTQNIISINTNSTPGGRIFFTATNTASGCNNTIQTVTGYMGSTTNCGTYSMAFIPNPSTSETTLELSTDGEKVVDENTQWDIEVYDQQQGLKEKSTKIKGKQTKINTSGWKDGIYIVRVLIDGELISEKLAVKH